MRARTTSATRSSPRTRTRDPCRRTSPTISSTGTGTSGRTGSVSTRSFSISRRRRTPTSRRATWMCRRISREARTPDSTSPPTEWKLCLAANADPNEWETTNKDLWLVPVSGGALKNITDENEAYDAQSPVLPRRPLHRLPHAGDSHVRGRPLPARALRPEDGREARSHRGARQLGRDSSSGRRIRRAIYFTADYHGTNPLYKVDIASLKIAEIANFRDDRLVRHFPRRPIGRRLAPFGRRAARDLDVPGRMGKG